MATQLFLNSPKVAIAYLFATAAFLYFLLWILGVITTKRGSKKSLPPPPKAKGARPFLGHLPLLGGPLPAHITLGNMADKYGPIFMLKLGVHRTIVVSSSEIAKECFTTQDKAFSSRPKYLAAELLGYNYAMFGFSPYGPYWRHIRKIATLELLSNHRLDSLRNIREAEVQASIREAYYTASKENNTKIDMKKWFAFTTCNVVMKMVVGKRFEGIDEDNASRNALRKLQELTGAFVISDVIPMLRWLDIGGYVKEMKKTAKELDDVLVEWLREHKERRRRCTPGEFKGGEQDFMDVMITLLDDAEELPSYDADTINKSTCLALILGGTDTTAVTLTWALSLLLNDREALKKAQQELDQQVGRERQVKDSDLPNLHYLQAILKETIRLYPAAPLSVPHEATEDCVLGGYHIPAGTRLLLNIPKIHYDPRLWSDPSKFQPERFLTGTCKDLDFRGQNFEYIPFGSGRRICPGISFAIHGSLTILATLLHSFDITTPGNEPVDMTEGVGLTNLKASPLEVHLTPRLPHHIYG